MSSELDAFRHMMGKEAPPVRYFVTGASFRYFAHSLMCADTRDPRELTEAPPVFFGTAFDLLDVPAGDPRTMFGLALPLPAGWTTIATGDDFEMYAPIRPGVTLTCHERFVDAYEKRGRSGRLIFFTVEKEFVLENGTVVLRRRIGGAAREPVPLLPGGGLTHVPPAAEGPGLPELTVGPVDVRHLSMFATATAEFVDIHYDADYARSVGLEGPIVQGLYKTALIGQMLKRWVGDSGSVARLSVEHRGVDLAGSVLTAGGSVRNEPARNDPRTQTCDVWVRNQDGMITTLGSAAIQAGGGRHR